MESKPLAIQARIFLGEQGSQEWLNWRREGVGASDQAVLAGVSKYATIPSLLLDKMGLSPPKENYGMLWGKSREADIAKIVLAKYQKEAKPMCIVHPELNFMRCSYDLMTDDFTWAVEVKTCNAKTYKELLLGRQPPDHYWQNHHQYAVTPELQELIYCAVHRDKGVDKEIFMHIRRDERLVQQCIENAEKFMNQLKEAKDSYGNF